MVAKTIEIYYVEFIMSQVWRLQVQDQGLGGVNSFLKTVKEVSVPGLTPWLVGGSLFPSLFTLFFIYACLCPNFPFS